MTLVRRHLVAVLSSLEALTDRSTARLERNAFTSRGPMSLGSLPG